MSKYCAVSLRTESGDSYVFCIEYKVLQDIVNHIEDYLGDELGYIYEINVDSAVSAERDDEIVKVIIDKLSSMGQE
ncbi:hypothetical protein [Pseudomonas sp.]|uniref:hypothetical protein n=1 Tax=Pseudomonas sp. TaxID=306 RepID=UPI003FD85449